MGWDSKPVYPPNADRRVTVRATSLQIIAWGDAARRHGKPVGAFIGWAADFTARYFSEKALQERHRQRDPILARLEEKKRLRRLLDVGWHALDFLPPARTVATLRHEAECKALAAELARLWVRWDGSEPSEDPGPALRFHL